MRSRNGPKVLALVALAFIALQAVAQDRPVTRSEREATRDAQAARDALQASAVQPSMDAETAFKLAQAEEAEGNVGDAIRIYRFAANKGSGRAALRLGEIYGKGVVAAKPDPRESLVWYQRARDLGEKIPTSQPGTADPRTRSGREKARDAEAAIKALEEARNQTEVVRQRSEVRKIEPEK